MKIKGIFPNFNEAFLTQGEDQNRVLDAVYVTQCAGLYLLLGFWEGTVSCFLLLTITPSNFLAVAF